VVVAGEVVEGAVVLVARAEVVAESAEVDRLIGERMVIAWVFVLYSSTMKNTGDILQVFYLLRLQGFTESLEGTSVQYKKIGKTD